MHTTVSVVYLFPAKGSSRAAEESRSAGVLEFQKLRSLLYEHLHDMVHGKIPGINVLKRSSAADGETTH